MAGCLSCTEKGNVSPENVKRWTEKLPNVLQSSTARNKFKSYLTDREFEDGQSLVEFWEMCDRFLKAHQRHHDTHRSRKENLDLEASCTKTGGADGVDQNSQLVLKEAEEIVQFAEDNIAFDAQMISLKDALHSGDTKKIVTVISEATQSAAEILEDKGYYKAFCQYLFQEKGLLRKGD